VQRVAVQRVVLVEDEAAIAAGIVMLLESEGVEVKAVELGGQAMSAIEAFRPDVVILDMSLPDMDGSRVFELISETWPTLPVLFSSGNGDQSSVDSFLRKGRVGFLRKPYGFDELLGALERLTDPGGKSKTGGL
jgi:DNA-binding response OmpR family regulator